MNIGTEFLGCTDKLYGVSGTDMLDHDSSTASKCEHTVTCNHYFFCDSRRTDNTKSGRSFSGIDTIVGDKGFVLFVETDRHMKGGCFLHSFITECGIKKRDSVICKSTGTGICQSIEIGQFFTIQSV